MPGRGRLWSRPHGPQGQPGAGREGRLLHSEAAAAPAGCSRHCALLPEAAAWRAQPPDGGWTEADRETVRATENSKDVARLSLGRVTDAAPRTVSARTRVGASHPAVASGSGQSAPGAAVPATPRRARKPGYSRGMSAQSHGEPACQRRERSLGSEWRRETCADLGGGAGRRLRLPGPPGAREDEASGGRGRGWVLDPNATSHPNKAGRVPAGAPAAG